MCRSLNHKSHQAGTSRVDLAERACISPQRTNLATLICMIGAMNNPQLSTPHTAKCNAHDCDGATPEARNDSPQNTGRSGEHRRGAALASSTAISRRGRCDTRGLARGCFGSASIGALVTTPAQLLCRGCLSRSALIPSPSAASGNVVVCHRPTGHATGPAPQRSVTAAGAGAGA